MLTTSAAVLGIKANDAISVKRRYEPFHFGPGSLLPLAKGARPIKAMTSLHRNISHENFKARKSERCNFMLCFQLMHNKVFKFIKSSNKQNIALAQLWKTENKSKLSILPHLLFDDLPFAMKTHSDMFRSRLEGENRQLVVRLFRTRGWCQVRSSKFMQRLETGMTTWRMASSHRNISDFIDLVSVDGLPAIVMPDYENGNVIDFLGQRPNIDVFPILIGVAEGLQYLHGQNPPIVHGKLRGSNILISDAGEPLLSDLGLRDLPYSEDLYVLNGNGDLDDVRWMAPELIDIPTCATTQGGCLVTCPSSDIYSFGMTALEILTKVPPFSNRRRAYAVITDLVAGRRPPRPQSMEVTDELWNLLTKCWAKEPQARPTIDVVLSWLSVLSLCNSSRQIYGEK
ncbi:LOW QUALITY PROTEIN: hypothetical protein CVT26_013796 [Gymnopilus dilepis]|uniref:Protein kinase domain-containing protein n=1 Tax=Gymnopilus dilepis TaxID=231916 RepID=A0A409VVS4_9AGAR|nr:LOW QUALITY PROTEIN: hypothetical protein CVT26_013796 [Gymnopilus dilepis]